MNKQNFLRLSRILAIAVIAAAVGMFTGARISSEHPVFAIAASAPSAILPGSLETGFASIVEKDLPAVVNISSSKVVRNRGGNLSPFLQDPFFRQFSADHFDNLPH